MNISLEFPLTDKNYFNQEHPKSKIVIGHTFSTNMNHYIGWVKRNSKKTSPFTIDIEGNIHKHFEPKFHSNFLDDKELDKEIISILIENQGYLTHNELKNEYFDYTHNIYKGEVVEKKWRNNQYWAIYNDNQYESLAKLVKMLCNEFKIPLNVVDHNTKIEHIKDYSGICYRANFNKLFTDLSPAWNYIKFKQLIENGK